MVFYLPNPHLVVVLVSRAVFIEGSVDTCGFQIRTIVNLETPKLHCNNIIINCLQYSITLLLEL